MPKLKDQYGNDMGLLQQIFTGVALMIPAPWDIQVLSDPEIDTPSCGSANHGYYSGGPEIVMVPAPFNAQCLFIALHEFGHVLLGHPSPIRPPPKTIGEQERAASMFALAVMQGKDVTLPSFTPYMAAGFADIQEYFAGLFEASAA